LQGKTNPHYACVEIADRFASDLGRLRSDSQGGNKS